MTLNKQRLTQLNGKMDPDLRVACMDVGKGREQGCGSFACMDVGKQREQGCGSFAYMDGKDCSRQSLCISTIHAGHSKQRENGYRSFAPEKALLGVACKDAGQGREQEAISFVRCSFGTTKQRASCLDWHFFRGNNNLHVSTRP